MTAKSILPHALWLLVAAGAFAAGALMRDGGSAADKAPGAESRRVLVTEGDSLAGGSGTTSGTSTGAASDASRDEIGAFLDKFRVSSTGRLNAEGMADAIREAIQESDPVKSSLKFAMLLEELDPSNVEAARDALMQTVSGWDTMRYLPLLGYKWGAMDGPSAVEAAQAQGGRESFIGTMTALSGWASEDPAAAMAWLEENAEDERAQGMWARGIIGSVASSDPDAATRMALKFAGEDGEGAAPYAEAIAREQIKKGLGGAESWMNSLEDANLKRGALQTIGQHLAQNDPAAAAAWIQKYESEPGSDRVIAQVADQWAEKDPQAAVAWATSLAPGESQSQAMRESFSEWSSNDPTAASQYLTGMQDGSAKDSAIAGLVRGTVREEPVAAMEWARAISDPELQHQTLVNTGAEWIRRDEIGAAEWIASSNLPTEVQAAIVEASENRGGRGDWGGRRGGPPGGR